MKLDKIKISNYRCYNEHEIEFKNISIVVGKNNAGKSTLIEALRLISIAVNRFDSVRYYEAPTWTDLPKVARGISPSIKSIGINTENIFHKYGQAPSIIQAYFSNEVIVTIFIGETAEIYCTLQSYGLKYITNKSDAAKLGIQQVNILPQITPLNKEEKLLGRDYVRQNLATDLASLHFRNQLSILNEYFPRFCELAEQSWSGLRIRELNQSNGLSGDAISLMVQDSGFVAEVGWMGHGLQMWLQIIWFLSRIDQNEIVILDEPDVYMHPDLQRKLIRSLIKKFNQVIVSTHSIEIISEVEAENILIINKESDKSIFASKVPVVQRILNSIGSIHNLQLTKLWSSKKLLIVEGEDINILKRLQNTLFPDSEESFESIPNFDIGGWGGWNYAKGSSMFLKNTVDEKIKIYCLFDSDFHTSEQKQLRMEEANALKVQMHIWSKKEIENYLLVPTAIMRILKIESKKPITIAVSDIQNKITEIAMAHRDDIIDSFATEIQSTNKKHAVSTLRKEAMQYVDNCEYRISGKLLMSELNIWLQKEFRVTVNPKKLAKNLERNEIDTELRNVIERIETCKDF